MARDDGHRVDGADTSVDEELSRLYRQGTQEEPSAAVDRRILAAARRQAHSGVRRWLRPLDTAWSIPASLAALIVLSVSLVLLVRLEIESGPVTPRTLEETPNIPARAKPGATRDELAAPAAPAQRRERQSHEVPAPSQHRSGAEVTAPAPEPETLQKSGSSAPAAGGLPAVKPEDGGAPARARTAPVQETPAPQVWLEEIERLLRAGKVDAARESLAHFRRRYPNHPVPEPLSAALAAPSPSPQ
jgi:hypothetical protein